MFWLAVTRPAYIVCLFKSFLALCQNQQVSALSSPSPHSSLLPPNSSLCDRAGSKRVMDLSLWTTGDSQSVPLRHDGQLVMLCCHRLLSSLTLRWSNNSYSCSFPGQRNLDTINVTPHSSHSQEKVSDMVWKSSNSAIWFSFGGEQCQLNNTCSHRFLIKWLQTAWFINGKESYS